MLLQRTQSSCVSRAAVRATGEGETGARVRCCFAPIQVQALLRVLIVSVALCMPWFARAAIQFDVFMGYGSGGGNDGIVREGNWFPVAMEIFNDGPGFDGTIELFSEQIGSGQTRKLRIELPNNTRKRVVFPVFGGNNRYASWNARLLDARGKVRAERSELQCKNIAWETFLMGAVPRSFGGLPQFPEPKGSRSDKLPQVTRMTAELFPYNPIALEGLDALYLSSEKALELKPDQVSSLVTWVNGGGHLLVGIEQAQDVASTAWLKAFLPAEIGDQGAVKSQGSLHSWMQTGAQLRNTELPTPGNPIVPVRPQPARPGRTQPVQAVNGYVALNPDPAFEQAALPAFRLKPRDGETMLSVGDMPLAVNAPRGRGQVTVLAFSPDREPFRSWKNKSWFWARLLRLPGDAFEQGNNYSYGGMTVDSVVGAMIETKQVRKLPVEWLLGLLVIYLLVIGPFDHFLLKRINRQMLTWVTFPAYVVLFSFLIYYIGYRLRAGESEWNELTLVDVMPRGEKAELRGRTFASLYSSANSRYLLASDQANATLRGEFLGRWAGNQEGGRTPMELGIQGFKAEVTVPVWSSLMYVNDWQAPGAMPFTVKVTPTGAQTEVVIENKLPRRLKDVHVAYLGRLFELGDLGANQTKTFKLEAQRAIPLNDFVRNQSGRFTTAVSTRRQAFGREQTSRIEPNMESLAAMSFIGLNAMASAYERNFLYPAGTDLSPVLVRGDLVVLALDENHSPLSPPLRRFTPPRTSQNTLLRLSVAVNRSSG